MGLLDIQHEINERKKREAEEIKSLSEPPSWVKKLAGAKFPKDRPVTIICQR